MNKKVNLFRLLSLLGAFGGLVLFAGDMLFYYAPDSDDFLLNMSQSSDRRIIWSAITALFATWFYLSGAVTVYAAFVRSSRLSRLTMITSFVAILTAYGIIHGAYVAIATSAKISANHQLDIKQASALAIQTNGVLRLFVYPFFLVFSFVFIKEVWQRRTLYPRWIIIFFPLITFPFLFIFDAVFSGTARIVFVGGFFNLILFVFFLASTIALWHRFDDSF